MENESTVFDYLEKYGDVSFRKLKLNEIDAVIFSALAYLNFESLKIPVKTIKFLTDGQIYRLVDSTSQRENNLLLIKKLRASKRFSKVKIMHAEGEKNTDDNQTQFAAVSFIIGLRKIVVAFRGTDGSVVGWKENLLMGCNDEVVAQKKAYQYFKKVKSLHIFSKFYICGHSKGGNLAYYAGLRAIKEKPSKNKIIHVYNFDGPGFLDKTLLDLPKKEIFSEKFSKYIPEECLVGIILDSSDNSKIVKSSGEKFGQHNLYNWGVNCQSKEFIYSDECTDLSKKIQAVFIELFKRMDRTEIKDIINMVENILGLDLSMHVDDLDIANPAVLFWKFLRYDNLEKEKKKKIKSDLIYLYNMFKVKNKK